MGATLSGLISGIDVDYFIDSMVNIEKARVATVQSKQKQAQVKIDTYSQFQSLISELARKATALKTEDSFNLFKITSSNDAIATFSAGSHSVEGNYALEVFQMAQAEKMVSGNGLVTSQTESLSSLGFTVGDIGINGTTITISDTDTLQDLRLKINSAKTTDGKSLGVTASVLKAADNNFRLVLTSSKVGTEGVAYSDVTGSTLQGLGFITDAAGNKGNEQQVLHSGGDFATAFDNLAVGQSIEYSGKDREGNAVSNLFIKSASSTMQDFFDQMKSTFHGMVDVTTDADGSLMVTDRVAGNSQLNISSLTINGIAESVSITQAGRNGNGVLSVGRQAYFSIDGMFMQSQTNTVTDAISGVTMALHTAQTGTTVNVAMQRDFDAITKNVNDMMGAYNALVRFSRDNTAYASTEDESKATNGKLAGDMTVRSILSRIRSVFQTRFENIGSMYSTLGDLGVKTDTKTGEFSLDSAKFKDALQEHFEDVVNVFASRGFADNSNVVVGRYTRDTLAGKYEVEEVDGEHARIRVVGSDEWFTSSARTGEIVSFEDGPAKGLSLTLSTGVLGGSSTTLTFYRGMGELISDVANDMTKANEGLVAIRQKTLRDGIGRMDDRIARMNVSIEAYRERLVRQFSALEQTMASLQSQSSNMLATIGYSTTK